MENMKLGFKKLNFKLDKRTISALFSILCSLIIVILGVIVISNANSLPSSVYISNAYVSSYSFGADFYTEMYNVTYKAVEQLQNLADGVESGVTRVLAALKTAVKGIGMLVVALGIFSLMRSVPAVLELLPEKKEKAQEPAVLAVETAEVAETAEIVEEVKETEPVQEEQETAETEAM